jgi:NADP-reducing hydrogenase subunit HndB
MDKRIDSREALKALRERVRQDLEPRAGDQQIRITVHMGTCGIAAGARDVIHHLADQLDRENLHDIALTRAGCAGLCDQEPMITVRDASGAEFRYGRLDTRKIEEIVRGHVLRGVPVRKYLITA